MSWGVQKGGFFFLSFGSTLMVRTLGGSYTSLLAVFSLTRKKHKIAVGRNTPSETQKAIRNGGHESGQTATRGVDLVAKA